MIPQVAILIVECYGQIWKTGDVWLCSTFCPYKGRHFDYNSGLSTTPGDWFDGRSRKPFCNTWLWTWIKVLSKFCGTLNIYIIVKYCFGQFWPMFTYRPHLNYLRISRSERFFRVSVKYIPNIKVVFRNSFSN